MVLDPARKALHTLPKHYQKLVMDRIESLLENPRPHGCKKLQGQEAFRVRQGPYRILYAIDDSALLVVVSNIKPRREAYR
ncbi:MAG: mRNA interferase RelE/StbE [Thermodesulfobacteriota bacterium]|nr:mRNA interferase RelE/StbE [Thermodesulfobacteriota bacterium]